MHTGPAVDVDSIFGSNGASRNGEMPNGRSRSAATDFMKNFETKFAAMDQKIHDLESENQMLKSFHESNMEHRHIEAIQKEMTRSMETSGESIERMVMSGMEVSCVNECTVFIEVD